MAALWRISKGRFNALIRSCSSHKPNAYALPPQIHTSSSIYRSFCATSAEQMQMVKKLREQTSAPIKDVKSSLVQCNWNIEAAQNDLRKRGIISASKKSNRMAAEGLLAVATHNGRAAVIELNCETDFVARNEIFQHLALSLAKHSLSLEPGSNMPGIVPIEIQTLEESKIHLEHPKVEGEAIVGNAVTEVAAIMGENVKVRRGFTIFAGLNGVLSSYLHTSPRAGLGRIAGILLLEIEEGSVNSEEIQRVGSELAMHVVASKPLFLTKDVVPSDALEKEREILASQAEKTAKSQMQLDKMVQGRLRKFYEEVVLMEQPFVVNDSLTVKQLIDNLSNQLGARVSIPSFLRVEVGEGLQK